MQGQAWAVLENREDQESGLWEAGFVVSRWRNDSWLPWEDVIGLFEMLHRLVGKWNSLLKVKQELCLVPLARESYLWERSWGGELVNRPFETLMILPIVGSAPNTEPSFQALHHTSQGRRPYTCTQCPASPPLS